MSWPEFIATMIVGFALVLGLILLGRKIDLLEQELKQAQGLQPIPSKEPYLMRLLRRMLMRPK